MIYNFFIRFLKKQKKSKNYPNINLYEGFDDWDQALNLCSGYDSEIIVDKCFDSILKIVNGTSIYERDSVLFDKKEYSYGVVTSLLLAANYNNKHLSLLDFGGSFGSTFFQNQEFLSYFKSVKWGVVEQESFYLRGKKHIETNELMFFDTIDNCVLSISPDIFLISSSLQYLRSPSSFLKDLNCSGIEFIIFDRISFSIYPNFITIQKVPESIYDASYPCWILNKDWLLNVLDKYENLLEFPSFCDLEQLTNKGKKVVYNGLTLRLKK